MYTITTIVLLLTTCNSEHAHRNNICWWMMILYLRQVRRWITLPLPLRCTHGIIPPCHDRILRLCRLGTHTLRGLELGYGLHGGAVSSLRTCHTCVHVIVYCDWLDAMVDGDVRLDGICHEWLRWKWELRW